MAKSKFSISEGMLNSISKNIDKSNLIDAKENFKFDYIDIDKLKVNNKNFYPIIDIETLAEDISINGLNHNLVIRPIEDGFYEIISGERRYSALKSLVDKGDNKYSKVPCKIVNLNDVDSEITLIQANAQTRELSDADKLKQIERLTELYKEKKKNGEKVTNIRKLVSKDIGLSEGQVAKYSTVSNNLIPELRTILDEGNLSISNATEFSSLSEENQKIILDIINKRVDISRNEAVEIKKQLKEIELEKNRIIEREKQKSEEILKLKSENETKSIEIDTKIEQVKKEILENSNKEKEELIKKLNSLEDDKKKLENEKEELENSIKNSNESTKEEIEHEVNQRLEEIKSQFEKDNLKLKEENKKLKEKINYIIHGAGPTDSRYFAECPVETIKTSVFGTINVLEFAKQNDISGMVYLSSMEIYGANKKKEKINEIHECNVDTMLARNSYPESKRMCENLCASFYSEYNVPINVLRLTQTFGPGIDKNDNRVFAQFLKSYFNGQDIILKTQGKTCRSYLYTADAVTAILAVLLCGKYNNVYNCANEDTYCSIKDMANLVANDIGKGKINVILDKNEECELKVYLPENYMDLDVSGIKMLGWRTSINLEGMFRNIIECRNIKNSNYINCKDVNK